VRLRKPLALAGAVAALAIVLLAVAHPRPRSLPSIPVAGALSSSAADHPDHHGHHSHRDHPWTWTWPLVPLSGASRPVVVHRFEPPAQRWQAGHRGVDLLGGPGQEVMAAGAGTVSYAGVLFGRPVVAVDHPMPGRDTLRTTYEPVDPVVKAGDAVRSGQVIGHLVDSVAGHCAPRTCLHWGLVRGSGRGGRYLDPLGLVGRGAVRLLPVWGMR